MKLKFHCFVAALLCISSVVLSQDYNNPQWNIPSSVVFASGEYVNLPYEPYIHPVTEPKVIHTPQGDLLVFPNIRVLPNTNQQTELYLAIARNNPTFMFGSSNRTSGANINSGSYITTNGGTTWFGQDFINNGNTNNQRGDPGPAIGKDSRVIFTHLSSNTNFGGVTGMAAEYSTDFGQTFSASVQVHLSGSDDKNLACGDDVPTSPFYGNFYMAYCNLSGATSTLVSRTTDGGVTWQPAVSWAPSAGLGAQGHDIVTRPNGDVVTVYALRSNSSPFTEMALGVGRSTDGGVTFTPIQPAYSTFGTRSTSFNGWGIRTNGFPRVACDKSGGVRNGWLYVVMSEYNLAPAGSDADIVLHRSTDGGLTWSAGVRVNQDALNNGAKQFFPCVAVDENGGVNVAYYDNRAFPPVGDSCSVYISRSTDGGSTFVDAEVADHHFRPKPTPGLGGGYMGDYIGIAAGNGKVWAFWMDDKAGPFQAWAGYLQTSAPPPPATNRHIILPTPAVNTNYISIPHQTSMLGFSNMTIEAWVKYSSLTNGSIILNKGGASYDYQLGVYPNGGLFFRLQNFIATATSGALTTGVWTHVAASYDGSNARFYKNGALVSTIPLVAVAGSSAGEMRIGRGGNDPGQGNIEELRLWTVTRTQPQIDSNKCRKWRNDLTSSTGIKAIWHFDSTYTDSVSNYNGTPQGSVVFDTVSFPIPGANCNLVGIQTIGTSIPENYSLEQNYPNPFNPQTNIRFSIPKGEFVEITIFDITGKEIAVVLREPLEAGYYNADFNAVNLASGIYFYKITAGEYSNVKKMVLIK